MEGVIEATFRIYGEVLQKILHMRRSLQARLDMQK